jgi:hypothetical protein
VKRAFASLILTIFCAPLLLLSSFTLVHESDPALAAGPVSVDARALLENPGVSLSSNARADLEAGIIDERLISLLSWISQRHTFHVGVFKTGHHKYVRGTYRISNHWYGRAADISIIDGEAVGPSSLPTRQVVSDISRLDPVLRPDEVGHPLSGLPFTGGFTDADHRSHVHLAYR